MSIYSELSASCKKSDDAAEGTELNYNWRPYRPFQSNKMYEVQSDSGPLCAEKILPVEEPSNEQKDDKVSGVARFTEATDFQRVASLIASHSFSSSLSFHLPDVAKRSMDVAITVMQTSVVTLGH